MAIKRSTQAKAVLFDLDGVLVRSDRLHFLAWKQVSDAHGWLFDESVNNLLRGVPRMDSLKIILRHNKIEVSEIEAEKLAEEKNEIFKASLKSLSVLDFVPGALDLVRGARELGAKTAICSSSRNAPAIVKALDMEPLFEAVISAKDVSKAKPDPEIFLAGAKALGVKPKLCVVVEDAQSGIDAALAAGMRCVGFCPDGVLKGATLTTSKFLGFSPALLLAPDAPAR